MLNRSKIISSSSNQNVIQTLPITCQICLSRVKDPCVCSNLHAFCKCCIDLWLEKSKQCPTCRVDINQENPCRRILGGIDNNDEIDQLKPIDFSNSSVRKARYMNIFEQYEDEIERLCKFIDSLNNEISKQKENFHSISNQNATNFSENEIQLNTKLEQIQSTLNETLTDRDKLKEANTKLESENSILMQDIMRLRASLSEKNSQMSNRYTVAALETKIESYEKEIKQLQKALDKSDKYIAELETKQNIVPTSSKLLDTKLSQEISSSKNVKFSDKIDTIRLDEIKTDTNNENMCLSNTKKANFIPKDNFYGSPSKTPNKTPNKMTPSKTLANSETSNKISSFSDRLKMMSSSSTSTTNAEVTGSLPQTNTVLTSDQQLLLGNNNSSACNWFSPMKRLRIEEKIDYSTSIQSDNSYQLLLNDSNSNLQNACLENISNIPMTTPSYFNPNLTSFNFISNQLDSSVFQTYQLDSYNSNQIQSSNQFETNNVPRSDNY